MRKIIFFIAGIVLLLLLFAAFTLLLPSKVTVSKSIRIDAPDSSIITQINNFNNWQNWLPAFRNSNVLVSIPHDQNTVAELSDKHERQILFKMLAVSNIKIEVGLFVKGKNTTTYQFILMPIGPASTEVTWNVTTNLGWYPWKKLQGVVMDKITGEQYLTALQSLKEVAEGHSPAGSPE